PHDRTAAAAGVTAAAVRGWHLEVLGPVPYRPSLAELTALPQAAARLSIAGVGGWSTEAGWSGVRIRDLMVRACGRCPWKGAARTG
ncbi:molybdopterin-dependent oxidoreductase, partial [Streptomyces sp. NPDC004050]